jgi:pimeloyl-ACP methyl ester carboxylesterase
MSTMKTPQNNKKHPLKSIPIRIGINFLVGYCILILLLAGCQNRYIYYPQNATESAMRRMAERVGLEPVETEGGIIGWQRGLDSDDAGPQAVFIVFHGNAGHAVHRSYYADIFDDHSNKRWATVILEYPGYGARSGRPSEHLLIEAADELIQSVRKHTDAPLILVGESLGSGVATGILARDPDAINGLILITPFDSLTSVASHHFPFAPVRLFLRDRFDNAANLKAFAGPLAILMAENDSVVPARFGKRLYESYQGGPKLHYIQQGRDHNTLDLLSSHPFWKQAFELLGKF